MKKVLFITPYYTPNTVGGAEISTQLIAEGFPNESVVLTGSRCERERTLNDVIIIERARKLLVGGWSKTLSNTAYSALDTIYLNILNIIPIRKWVKDYEQLISSNNIGVIVCNTNVDALGRMSLWRAAYQKKVPIILVLRDPMLLRKKLFGLDMGWLFRCVIRNQLHYIKCFSAPSQYMIDLYSSKGLRKNDNYVIPNAVDIAFATPLYDKRQNTIIYAGSIRTEKGILTLLKACEAQIFQTPDMILKLFGRGDLEELCKGKHYVMLSEWVQRDELYNEMKKAKVVVLPAEYPEAFGRVLVEAVANGTLVVGSDAGGIPEILDNDERYMFQAKSVEGLSKCIKRIMALSPEDYVSEVMELQNRFKRYSYECYVKNWKGLLYKFLNP